jgi:pimeloyl-ACP methyl ester carboxylesterase
MSLARERGLVDVVDIVSDQLLRQAPAAEADRVAEFVVAARRYAEANPKPAWLPGLATDEQLLNLLVNEVNTQAGASAGVNALGGFGALFGRIAAAGAQVKQAVQSAAGTVLNRTGDFASTKLLAWQRKPLNATLGRFFGDIFVYLDGRGDKADPGQIPTRILAAFDAARNAAPNEPLVIIGHSLGGVITFDLLSYFRTDLVIDLFITVGSQVSHFEEMKRFKSSDKNVGPPNRAATPANIRRWINVFDEVDIFSYACDKVFDRVHDFHYDTQTYTIKAHGAYFDQDRFYSRLRTRIDQLP